MGGTKGNSLAKVGYGCEMANLVSSWRKLWSRIPGTTDALAPFGIVTLASSGSEGGPDMGAMRWAQTANYGVLPNPAIPNSFVAQAYDLDDPWGPAAGPCFDEWQCCSYKHVVYNATQCNIGTRGNASMCDLACAAAADTPVKMGGIHPRDKKPVGDRLGAAAFNTAYGGKKPFTGPTLAGCAVDTSTNQLVMTFNQTLLRGDQLEIQPYNRTLNMSYLEVQTDPTIFCVEVQNVNSSCRGTCPKFCPTWAGGSSITNNSALVSSDQGWSPLNISLASTASIAADLSPLGSAPPTAVRYAWGTSECCDKSDPTLYVTHPCGPAPCPLMSKDSAFPANPFIAKIVSGKCQCIAPQTCG
jgi:sialate O-acetylesterase